ncbi:hypothetical protein ACFQT0_00695 [Hymenobacter humi]|uniref:Uncharacterized protein n=1 Tax=Hymenobacter humi TaxID=1411620 RepID=A0ABW2TY51_9BACT
MERANICIQQIPQSPLYNSGPAADTAAMHRLHGEALTLRAQYYFEPGAQLGRRARAVLAVGFGPGLQPAQRRPQRHPQPPRGRPGPGLQAGAVPQPRRRTQ